MKTREYIQKGQTEWIARRVQLELISQLNARLSRETPYGNLKEEDVQKNTIMAKHLAALREMSVQQFLELDIEQLYRECFGKPLEYNRKIREAIEG